MISTIKKPFFENIEKLTNNNIDYRKVLFTGNNMQFVLMSLQPNEDIQMEVHKNHDQFIRIEQGTGIAIINNEEYKLEDGIGLIIPAGSCHRIINTGLNNLKLYTIYAPPEHPDKLIQQNKPIDDIDSNKLKKKYLKYKNKYLESKKN